MTIEATAHDGFKLRVNGHLLGSHTFQETQDVPCVVIHTDNNAEKDYSIRSLGWGKGGWVEDQHLDAGRQVGHWGVTFTGS